MTKKVVTGLFLCFLSSFYGVYGYFHNKRPVAEVGECLSLVMGDDGSRLKVKVIHNDKITRTSVIISEHDLVDDVSFGDLRNMDAKKVPCEDM